MARIKLAIGMLLATPFSFSFSLGCATILGFDDFEGEGANQATPGCEGDECPETSCEPAETRCSGGETELVAQICNEAQDAFEDADLCDVGDLQCNPTTGSCFELKLDETEVTRKSYTDFAAANIDGSSQANGCSWNDSFAPDETCMADDAVCSGDDCDQHPQVCVDWCDAAAYCEWRGQRLCGAIGDGALVDFDDGYADPGQSEWMNACSAAGQFIFGHGNEGPETDPQACTYDARLGTTYPVGTRDDCQSPGRSYKSIRDMSGNVAEWENNCAKTATTSGDGAGVACRVRGGSFLSPLNELKCAVVPAIAQKRSAVAPTIGFRCCSD
jgi:formylglycine-generating enzyme